MNEQNGHQIPFPSPFDSAFGNFMEPLASPNGNSGSGSHGASSSCSFVTSEMKTHYDETSQYIVEGGCVSDTGAFDIQGNSHFDTGSTYTHNFGGSSFQTDLGDANMLDDCQSQDLSRRAGLLYFGQCENTKNESQTTRSKSECRIAGFQDLKKLLPQSAKNKEEVIDKSIEYVKHLQLQLKELSQNKLGSETDTDPLITLKGSNIHLPAQVFLEEFKDIFGRLLKENPAAAKKLLESHGLLMVPTALLKALRHKE